MEVFAQRSDLLLSAWEDAHNDEGPAVNEDAISGLVRQTMTLDLSGLMEESAPEQRQPRTQPALSVAGSVDKAALLEAFNSEIELVEAQAHAESAVGAAADDEDVGAWAGAITRWMATRSSPEPVSLIELQRELGMPLIEIWMGLLLARAGSYQLVQQGEDFYALQGVSVATLTPEVKLIELAELRMR